MKLELEQKYEKLYEEYRFERKINSYNINAIIKKSLQKFLRESKRPALYCNGGHTKMLMSDFMFELKSVKYIIDNYANKSENLGFCLIRSKEMEEHEIDAVIISSYKFKDKIIEDLKENHPSISYLNIYEKLRENGINLQSDYYHHNHPYHYYRMINSIQRSIADIENDDEIEKAYWGLVTEYIHIKDFCSAIKYAKSLFDLTKVDKYHHLIQDLEYLYEKEKEAASHIAQDNVLMFCMDGLRNQDFVKEYMPKLTEVFEDTGFIFERGYSFSTSTFESLIPVYSENDDLRTEYYNKGFVEERDCRFIKEAKRQGRCIHFYTDMDHFIEGDNIHYSEKFQTITEKLWDFIQDAVEEENGLFYIHELYESHFAFSNPYTKDKLISEGTALLFDYLPQKGGQLRTDYECQHMDALRYLDDVLFPFFELMKCRMVVFADHGNLILKKDFKLENIKETKLVCDEEWVRIAYMIRSPEMGVDRCNSLISLMTLNDVVIALMNKRKYRVPAPSYIKLARSELYNPDFRYLYKKLDKEKSLLAFEAFVFDSGYKLLIYSDGTVELFLAAADKKIINSELAGELIKEVQEQITVCTLENLKF